jgi:phage baseplate assembly protein W
MGYFLQTANDVTQNNEVGLGVSFSTNKGLFDSIYTSDAQTRENLKTLLLTRKGERIMQPTYGTDLITILFEPNLSELKSEIQTLLKAPITYWLPYINIESIDIITNEDDPTLIHNIKITINYSVDSLDTNTITLTSNGSSITVD